MLMILVPAAALVKSFVLMLAAGALLVENLAHDARSCCPFG